LQRIGAPENLGRGTVAVDIPPNPQMAQKRRCSSSKPAPQRWRTLRMRPTANCRLAAFAMARTSRRNSCNAWLRLYRGGVEAAGAAIQCMRGVTRAVTRVVCVRRDASESATSIMVRPVARSTSPLPMR
jgi:hypothetical protein